MSVTPLDTAIVAEYPVFKVPADQIVADPKLGTEFLARVNQSLPPGSQVDLATINKRLLNLRRRGEAKGGLPRLERDYRGRGPNKPR